MLHPHRGHRRYALRDGQIVVPNFHRLLLPGFPAAEIADHVFVDWNLPQFSPSSVVACFEAGRAPMQFCEFSYPSLDGVCIERLETPQTAPFPDCEAGRVSIGTVWVLVGVFIWLEHLGLPLAAATLVHTSSNEIVGNLIGGNLEHPHKRVKLPLCVGEPALEPPL